MPRRAWWPRRSRHRSRRASAGRGDSQCSARREDGHLDHRRDAGGDSYEERTASSGRDDERNECPRGLGRERERRRRVQRKQRAEALMLKPCSEADGSDRPADARPQADTPYSVSCAPPSVPSARESERGAPGDWAAPRRRTAPRMAQTFIPEAISARAAAVVVSEETTSARDVPSRVSAKWLQTGPATREVAAEAATTNPMRSGARPRSAGGERRTE